MTNKILSIALVICLTIMQTVSAQWQATSGPTPPNIVTECISGSNLFASSPLASTNSVALTTDSGTTWTNTMNGLTTQIISLTSKGNIVFAGGTGGNLFQTSNNGTLWTSSNTGLSTYDINALFVGGSNIYAATFGVYKSNNNGANWSKLNSTWNATVSCLFVSGDTILAGTPSNGIYMSVDSGTTWATINTGLPSQVNAILINGNKYFAGTPSGIYQSINFGASWTISNITDNISSFNAIGNNIFAGSQNGGGVYLTTNNGGIWSPINTGLTNLTVYSLVSNGTYIYAGTTGLVWKRLLSDVLPATFTVTTSSNPTNGGTTTGNGSYTSGSSVTISATPNSGYTFTNWTENSTVLSTNSSYTFTISANRNLVANFTLTSSGINNIDNNSFKIYPNPSNGNLFVSATKECDLTIYNSLGQTVLSTHINKGETKLVIHDNGMFLFAFEQNGNRQQLTRQIINK